LLARGARVRALDIDPERVRAILPEGVEVGRLEFGNPATYGAAFAGASELFLMRPPQITDVERLIHPAVEAARKAGVRHVVFLSLQGVEKNRVVPHAKTEKYLMRSAIPYTMLRPSFFMQNLSTTHRQDVREGEIVVPAGRGRTSFVDVRDIAAVAAKTLTEPGHDGKTYELTGQDSLTYDEVAATLTRVLGRPVRYARPGILRFWRSMRRRGMPAPFILVMTALYTVCRLGLAGRVTSETERLLGRKPISFEQFARDNARVWN
ncbi:MAG TPA: SDR family oxidoreductase, partial [Deinococcales bacterium]|nr:SDR family oxidoreductase [Deinococcales bacterium]